MSKLALIDRADQLPNLTWIEPEPLVPPDSKPTAFPLSALGSMEAAARDIQSNVKCPPALAAASVLSAASMAAQGAYNVVFRGQDTRPLSLFILTIGRSGERKSTADSYAMIGVHRRIKELRAQVRHQRQMNEASDGEPFPILSPEILASNGTVEGLQQGFLEGHPAQALMSDEAGQFLGGHSLRAENKLHGLATLSKFWDGGTITKKIKGTGITSETKTMIDCRLTVHMLGQRIAIAPFLKDATARGQGSLARFLVHEPSSTMGTRHMTVEEWNDNAVTENVLAFADRIEALLEAASVRSSDGEVERETLQLSDEAVSELVRFYNSVEAMLAPTGDLSGHADLANKVHENAARIAGVLAVMDDEKIISGQTMRRGIKLASYFLSEVVRLSDLLPTSTVIDKARAIADWLTKKGGSQELRELSRKGPKSCRSKPDRQEAVTLLQEKGWIRVTGNRIELNPMLGDTGDTGDKPSKGLLPNGKSVAHSRATTGATV